MPIAQTQNNIVLAGNKSSLADVQLTVNSITPNEYYTEQTLNLDASASDYEIYKIFINGVEIHNIDLNKNTITYKVENMIEEPHLTPYMNIEIIYKQIYTVALTTDPVANK